MSPEFLAGFESRLRPLLTRLPWPLAVSIYSAGRRRFVETFVRHPPAESFAPVGLERTLWGLSFRSPIINAAGMFKNGEGYEAAARQGAGAFLAGTTTHRRRRGNSRMGVALPFAPYPRSGAASNWLGLPNVGHRAVARRLEGVARRPGCPVGVSAAVCLDAPVAGEQRLEQLVAGLERYQAAGVDFLEINESCPNTAEDPGGIEGLRERLGYVAEHFLAHRLANRGRVLPVVVKLSCDTAPEDATRVVAELVDLGFDGVNFGNTSTAYGRHRKRLAGVEVGLFDDFTRVFGGGLSGRPLKADSLRLVTAVAEFLTANPPDQEFHVVRTGGIEDADDVRQSLAAGASLCQWYTGYFEAFGRHGHAVYRKLYSRLRRAVAATIMP